MTTESDGQFAFPNVSPGRYRLNVRRQGYARPEQPITVAAGRTQPPIQLSMTPVGAIYGRVFDTAGQPAGAVAVQALKASYPEGRRVLTPVQTVVTNDLGEYRLFWLAPGRYYVVAIHPQTGRKSGRFNTAAGNRITLGPGGGVVYLSNSNTDPALGTFADGFESEAAEAAEYVPVYFGGTTDQQLASGIDVRPSTEFGGADITLSPVYPRRVRGVVLDVATGKPAQYPSLRIGDRRSFRGGDEPDVDPDTGAFDILLLPGLHTLTASSAWGSGSVTLKVADLDIDNVTIVTSMGFNVPGRIAVEGGTLSTADLESLRISLRPDPPPANEESPAFTSYSVPLPDGSFTVDANIGNYRVNLAPILNITPARLPFAVRPSLENAYLQSIRMGDTDVLNNGLRLERAPAEALEIVIGLNAGAIQGQARSDASVVLVPEARRRTELYRMVTADSAGRFQFDRVPPGNYKVFAFEEVENSAWFDAEFMKIHENSGRPVRVVEGSTEQVKDE